MAVGDFLGSASANTFILGLVALLSPIVIENKMKIYLSLGMLFLTLLVFNAFFVSDKKLTRLEGLSLVAMYAYFLLLEVFLRLLLQNSGRTAQQFFDRLYLLK